MPETTVVSTQKVDIHSMTFALLVAYPSPCMSKVFFFVCLCTVFLGHEEHSSFQSQLMNGCDVTGKHTFFPFCCKLDAGRIVLRNQTVSQGDSVAVQCMAVETKTQSALNMYLCKDGTAFNIDFVQAISSTAHFTLTQVSAEDSITAACTQDKNIPDLMSDAQTLTLLSWEVIGNFL